MRSSDIMLWNYSSSYHLVLKCLENTSKFEGLEISLMVGRDVLFPAKQITSLEKQYL